MTLTNRDLAAMQQCGAELPCGMRDRKWLLHVCYLPYDHPDVDSPCRCVICAPPEEE